MDQSFRRDDKAFREEFVAALRDCVFSAQPSFSIGQIAGLLTSGTDDLDAVSESTLYKAIEGKRRIATHKLARLSEITGSSSVIECLARQHGAILYWPASGDDIDTVAIPATLKEFAELITAVSDGAASKEQCNRIQKEGGEAIAAILHLMAECAKEQK